MWLQLRQNSWRLILCVNELNICICVLCVCFCVFVCYFVFVTGTNNLFVSGGKMFISHRGTNIFTHKEGQTFLYWGDRWGKYVCTQGRKGNHFQLYVGQGKRVKMLQSNLKIRVGGNTSRYTRSHHLCWRIGYETYLL